MKKILAILSCLLFILGSNNAQQFKAKTSLGSISHDGIYKVLLSSDLRAFAQKDFSDIRLSSSSDSLVEMAYFLKHENSPTNQEIFEPLVWEQIAHGGNSFYLVRTNKRSTNGFALKVANHRNERYFSLSGSNNKKDWYAISDKEILNPIIESNQPFYWRQLVLPHTEYDYLKIQFLDSAQLPIKILDIGNLYSDLWQSQPQTISNIQFFYEELPKQKSTQIKLFSDRKQQIDELLFIIQEPTFFLREAKIYRNILVQEKRKASHFVKEYLGNFILKSGTQNTFQWSHFLTDTIFIEIENLNNAPLKIEKIELKQNPVYLFAFCKANQHPTIFVGDSLMKAPQYDLGVFSEEILRAKVEALQLGAIQSLATKVNTVQDSPFWQKDSFLWICLGIGGISILAFSVKLLNEKK